MRVVNVTGTTVSVAVALPPAVDAVTVTVVFAVTLPPVAVKVPVVCPAAMVIVAGTESALTADDARLTVKPPVGAGELIVTVPDAVPPFVTP